MNRVRTPHLEPLEGRRLLSGAHARVAHAHVHAHPAVTAAPLVFSGTLAVNTHASTSQSNQNGGLTTVAPVSGQLAGLGHVHGVWFESSDQFGNYMGPDTITLHTAQGGFTIAFSNASSGPAHRSGHTVYYQHAQHSVSSSGAFAKASETGAINLNENASHTQVVSLTLNGQ